LESKKHLV